MTTRVPGSTPQAARAASTRSGSIRVGSNRAMSMWEGMTMMRSAATRWRSEIDVRDLLAHGDHLLATRHHAVIGMLEQVLIAKSSIPGGEEGNSGHAGGGIAAPPRRPGECVHHPAMALPDQPCQHECIACDDDGIDARHVEAHELAAAGRQIAFEPSAAGNHHARCPALVSVRASSTASSSAAPVSSVGTAIMTVKGRRAKAGAKGDFEVPAKSARSSMRLRATVDMSATSPTPCT